MPEIVNMENLSQAAKTYDPILKTLPALTLEPVLTSLGINLLQVNDGDNVETTEERRGGILRPMSLSSDENTDASESELIRFVEMTLTPKLACAALKDNILNYTEEKKVLNNVFKVNNQTKEHPWAARILMAKVKTIAEDMLDASFHSLRDESDPSPLGISDGYYTIQDKFVAAGEISLAKKNLIEIGALTKPADKTDTIAYDSLLEWIRALHPSFRGSQFMTYVPGGVLMNVKDALGNKYKYLQRITLNDLEAILAEESNAPGLMLRTNPCLGTGTRIFSCGLGDLDYGLTGIGDREFVQVRNPYKNPNWIQYWTQLKLGQRIKSLHVKRFTMTQGTTESLSLSGDYQLS